MKNSISRLNLSEQISEIIKKEIEDDIYGDGDKLPSEKELTEIYEVSRLTIRSAIQRLNAINLVETKAGDGTYVKKFDLESYLKEVSSKIMHPEMLENVSEFRILLETESIKLTIKRASDKELLLLKDLGEEYIKTYEKNMLNKETIDNKELMEIVDCDYNFHLYICELSKNTLYKMSYLAAQEPIKLFLKTIIESRFNTSRKFGLDSEFDKSYRNHYDIYQAIHERDVNKAQKLIKSMVDYKILDIPSH